MTLIAGPVVALVWACAVLSASAEDSKWVWGGGVGGGSPSRLVNDNHRAESLRDRELVEEFPVRRPLFRPAQDYQPGDRPNFRPPTRLSEVDSLNRLGPQTFSKPPPPRRIAENDRRPSTRGPGGSQRDYDRFGQGNGPDRFGGPNRPGNFGPDGPGNFGGPGGSGLGGPGIGGPGFGGQGGPGGQGQGGPAILTGPVPSWEQGRLDGPFQGFDRCKCAHSFNCISPGIQFGQCGEGKMYCCHNSIHEGGGGSNLERDALGVTGPGIGPGVGGGVGGIGQGIGPGIGPGNGRPGPGNFDRPFPNGDRPLLGGNGLGGDRPILVGPGGPTGIVSEGLGGRPFSVGGLGGVRPGGIGPGGIGPGGIGPGGGPGGVGPGGNRPFLPDGSGIGAGGPIRGNGGRPTGFNGGRPLGFNGGAGNRPFVDYDDEFIGRNTNGKFSVSRYEPSTLNSRSNAAQRDSEVDKEAVVIEAAKPEVAKN